MPRKAKEFTAYLSDEAVADRLNEALGLKGRARLTARNVEDWVGETNGCGPTYAKAEKAIRRYMGDEMYDAAEALARMIPMLHARLQGIDEIVSGGMSLQNLTRGLK